MHTHAGALPDSQVDEDRLLSSTELCDELQVGIGGELMQSVREERRNARLSSSCSIRNVLRTACCACQFDLRDIDPPWVESRCRVRVHVGF